MKREEAFSFFIKSLEVAAREVSDEYFSVKFAGTDEQKYRERVFCYELYHQLRNHLPEMFFSSYKLHGEMDKKSHQTFTSNPILKDTIPDFIVHIPGIMEHNLVVIEVKNSRASKKEILDDITKLGEFVEAGNYLGGICYIYGLLSTEKEMELLEKQIHNVYLVIHKSRYELKVYPPQK